MKIYFTDIKSEHLDKLINNNYYIEILEYSLIFSLDGIYKVNKNSNIFYKLKILDAIVIHNTIDEWNILIYPAYSPDFNPIECIFSKLKTLYRKLEHNNIIEEVKSVINKITESDLLNCYNYTKKFIQITYSIKKNALVKFVILKNNKKISDFYFLYNGDIGDFLFREEILTFLSIIK